MFRKWKSFLQTDNFSYFIRYFAVFTLIFSLMTMLILQLMRSTVYHSSDKTFEKLEDNPSFVVHLSLARGAFGEEIPSLKPSEDWGITSNYQMMLYSREGKLLTGVDSFSGLERINPNKQLLGEIETIAVDTVFGHRESYRMMTLDVSQQEVLGLTDLDLGYAVILFNTTQIQQSLASYETTVILVMVVFWLISIGASLYLARLSLKPLLVSFQKQKDFVENASHELRTPLAVLQNRLETLFRKPEATILESSENIASSLEEVRNMRRLTTNLLNLARRDDGLKPEWSQVSPDFFDEIFANYQMVAEEQGRRLQVDNQMIESIRTDKLLIKQLMTILFDNAVKYTDEGGWIVIRLAYKDKYLIFTIADDGLGIADSDKEKIFDRFYRVDKARTRQKGGFGLGLSLAKQIVESLRGSISVKDNQPKGSLFQVKLPR